MPRPPALTPLAAVAALVVLTACDTGSPAPLPPRSMSAPEAAPALNAVRAFDLGQIVVDGAGLTLYRYDKDDADPPRSACDSACTRAWQPVPAAAARQLHGIDPALAGSMTRSDGTDQVTLAGFPLYRYRADEMPGETGGLGAGGAWFPVTPDGNTVRVTADPGQSDAFGP
ncbi:hypothetical protein GCM10027445_42280 [Amycolatopsis endophytica]|uniref:Putative lipoprotein with Yx(FWY)xxD motif n=1 Tax=Amycolatopsis endophytica TaxID=860233 RepID=A0A853B6D5_9PSEU|nr:hypothetical protein [Amycolatopsis endophytica]NYI90639.1 putative lipoprotein with Yx(FWY)xxD motif [Amycolatopsis endophytica]